jgi:hypothetical protein
MRPRKRNGDEALRELEREVRDGDRDALPRLAAAYARLGRVHEEAITSGPGQLSPILWEGTAELGGNEVDFRLLWVGPEHPFRDPRMSRGYVTVRFNPNLPNHGWGTPYAGIYGFTGLPDWVVRVFEANRYRIQKENPGHEETIRTAERAFLEDPEADDLRDRYLRELARRGVNLNGVIVEAIKAYGLDSPIVSALCEPFERPLIIRLDAEDEVIDSLDDDCPVLQILGSSGFWTGEWVMEEGTFIGPLPRGFNFFHSGSYTQPAWDKCNAIEKDYIELGRFDGEVSEMLGMEDEYASRVTYFQVVLFRTSTGHSVRLSERVVLETHGNASSENWWTIRYLKREGHS